MRALVVALLAVALAGCADSGPNRSIEEVTVEIKNAGTTPLAVHLEVRAQDGASLGKRTVTVGSSPHSESFPMPPGGMEARVWYEHTSDSGGSVQTVSGDRSHTLDPEDCPGGEARIVFSFTHTSGPSRQVHRAVTSQGVCP